MTTILQKLFISLFPLFLFAYNVSIENDINVYSDKLYLDIFDKKWKSIPSKKPLNIAIDYSNLRIFLFDDKFLMGVGYNSEGVVKINRGFIETWYYADKDFNTLLKRSNIGYYITTPKIYGILNYSQFNSFFVGKKYKNFNIEFSIIRGKLLQYMEVNGFNYKNHFVADLVYYYSDKNFLMEKYLKSDNYTGVGYSISANFYKNFNTFNVFLEFYNILGVIRWSDIILMKYHFDSNTKYIGDDGYYHYRPFGVGKFIKTNFYQKLPFFVKYKLKKQFKNFYLMDEGLYSSGSRFDTLFVGKGIFKIGFVPQIKNIVFGMEGKRYNMEVSNNIKYHSKFIKIYFKFTY